jgi:hypothetical protein
VYTEPFFTDGSVLAIAQHFDHPFRKSAEQHLQEGVAALQLALALVAPWVDAVDGRDFRSTASGALGTRIVPKPEPMLPSDFGSVKMEPSAPAAAAAPAASTTRGGGDDDDEDDKQHINKQTALDDALETLDIGNAGADSDHDSDRGDDDDAD